MRAYLIGTVGVLALTVGGCQDKTSDVPPAPESLPSVETSNPAIERNPLRDAYYGDLHVHTKNSFDAYIFNTRTTPDDAYRFAKGEAIGAAKGVSVKLGGPPLDFLGVTDHAEYLGIVPLMDDETTRIGQTKIAREVFAATDLRSARQAFLRVGRSFVLQEPIAELYDRGVMDSVWAQTVASADAHNEPGVFTTFNAYEFTSMRMVDDTNAANLHRNVVFKDAAPARIMSTLESNNPEDLWAWMDSERAAGREVMAIPHNSNASNGWMFDDVTFGGEPLSADYASTRMRNEPVVEMAQVKGTSEVHPALSPNDEFSDFEIYENFIGGTGKTTPTRGDFVRYALASGLKLAEDGKGNPFKFGFIGSSDTHLSAGSYSEDNHFGKFPAQSVGAAQRQSIPASGAKDWADNKNDTGQLLVSRQYAASGLAGVWAQSNTRADIFDAMARKETFATSGPRLKLRFFAGDYQDDILSQADMIERAYGNGVAMGGQLEAPKDAPSFLAWAVQDPLSYPLERLQIIKVWNEGGAPMERVIDIACAGGGAPVDGRCQNVGASVDISTCEVSKGKAAGEIKVQWADPNYKAGQSAAYYIRALEIPSCRWSTWDAVRNGTPPNPDLPTTVQDRVWSSPIWVE